MIRNAGYLLALSAILAPALAQAQLFTLTREQLIEYTAQNPFERFPDGRPKVPDALIESARGMSAEEVWAVLPGKGFRNQYEDGFQVLHPGKKGGVPSGPETACRPWSTCVCRRPRGLPQRPPHRSGGKRHPELILLAICIAVCNDIYNDQIGEPDVKALSIGP
jgi:hypothetical protein